MSKPKVRNNTYWLKRLELEHPAIHAKLMAKEILSVRSARAEAGLIRLPTRLDAMKREWNGATTAERAAFLRFLEGESGISIIPTKPIPAKSEKGAPEVPVVASRPTVPISIADGDRCLTPSGKTRLLAVMLRLGLYRKRMSKGTFDIKSGAMMREFGFDASDPSLSRAIRWGSQLAPGLISKLDEWLAKHE